MSAISDDIIAWINKNEMKLYGDGTSFKYSAIDCSADIGRKVSKATMARLCYVINGLWNGKARKIPTHERSLNYDQWEKVLTFARSLKLRPDETPESLARRMHKKVGTTVTVPMAEEALKLIRSNHERKEKAVLAAGATVGQGVGLAPGD